MKVNQNAEGPTGRRTNRRTDRRTNERAEGRTDERTDFGPGSEGRLTGRPPIEHANEGSKTKCILINNQPTDRHRQRQRKAKEKGKDDPDDDDDDVDWP